MLMRKHRILFQNNNILIPETITAQMNSVFLLMIKTRINESDFHLITSKFHLIESDFYLITSKFNLIENDFYLIISIFHLIENDFYLTESFCFIPLRNNHCYQWDY